MLSVRGEFGYWVFEGDWQEAQRPSWNYRAEDGGGIILDMVCHWRYVLDNLFGEVKTVSCLGTTDIPERVDEAGKRYKATTDDAAYATFQLGRRDRADQHELGDARLSRRSRHLPGRRHAGLGGGRAARLRDPAPQRDAAPGVESRRAADARFPQDLETVPNNTVYDNGFKTQWEMFIRHVGEDAPYSHTLIEGAKGVQLVECALQSWKERRWIDVAPIKALRRRNHEQARPADVVAATVTLPKADRTTEHYARRAAASGEARRPLNRVALAAAHVVADPFADNDPWLTAAPDWDRTLAYREYLWDLGLGVAEAMDTAQRGMGLDWPLALELIKRSARGRARRAARADLLRRRHRPSRSAEARSIDDVIRAYETQFEAIEGRRAHHPDGLARARPLAKGPTITPRSTTASCRRREPVIIHWLGDMFDPALAGYWGTRDLDAAMDVAVGVINANAAKVDGVKVSLLDKDKEIAMRRRLDKSVLMYTGDDFNYAELIAGDAQGYSHALLGIFDAIAPAARPRCRRWPTATFPASTPRSGRPCRCRATSSRRRRASTRPASSSWPISTAIRIISPCSAARRAPARRCISPSCSASPTGRACSTIRNGAAAHGARAGDLRHRGR